MHGNTLVQIFTIFVALSFPFALDTTIRFFQRSTPVVKQPSFPLYRVVLLFFLLLNSSSRTEQNHGWFLTRLAQFVTLSKFFVFKKKSSTLWKIENRRNVTRIAGTVPDKMEGMVKPGVSRYGTKCGVSVSILSFLLGITPGCETAKKILLATN